MNTIYLIALSQGLLFIAFLCLKKNQNQANGLLVAWLITICLTLFSSYLFRSGLIHTYPHLLGIDASFPLLTGPFLYLYAVLLIQKRDKLAVEDFLHLTPFLCYTLFLAVSLYSKSAEFKLGVLTQEVALTNRTVSTIIYAATILHAFVYSIVTFLALRSANFANQIVTRWLKTLIGFIVVINFLLILTLIGIAYPQTIFSYVRAQYLSLPIALLTYGIVFIALAYPKLFHYYQEIEIAKYRNSRLSKDQIDLIWKQLKTKMDQEKAYLKSNLTIDSLAKEMEVLGKDLSQVINDRSGTNFPSFINKYRIEEFKERIRSEQNKNLTLEAIALDCGFSNKSSFHTAFKKVEQTTPYSYVKNQLLPAKVRG